MTLTPDFTSTIFFLPHSSFAPRLPCQAKRTSASKPFSSFGLEAFYPMCLHDLLHRTKPGTKQVCSEPVLNERILIGPLDILSLSSGQTLHSSLDQAYFFGFFQSQLKSQLFQTIPVLFKYTLFSEEKDCLICYCIQGIDLFLASGRPSVSIFPSLNISVLFVEFRWYMHIV